MSVNNKELVALERKLARLGKDISPEIEQIIIAEGVYAAGRAKAIATSESGLHNTGDYKNNMHAGNKAITYNGSADYDGSRPRKSGNSYRIDLYNNLDYASHLEYGFRAHFVPGHWEGRSFVYQRGDKEGGMFVGKPGQVIRGHHAITRAAKDTKATQGARITRKLNEILEKHMGGAGK